MAEESETKVYSVKGIVEKISNCNVYLPGKDLDGNNGFIAGTIVNIRREDGLEQIVEYPYIIDGKDRKMLRGRLAEFTCIVTSQERYDNGYRKASLEYELRVHDGKDIIRCDMLKPITRIIGERYLNQ